MPPKPKYTRDEIVNAAFELARKNGLESVVAREVGKELGTSSSPIFTFFSGMDELKGEVVKCARAQLVEYLNGIFDYRPAFKEFGLRWVHFAIEEPELYRIIFTPEHSAVDLIALNSSELFEPIFASIIHEIRSSFGLSEEEAGEILNQMLIHANGIASFCIHNKELFSAEEISRTISEVCIGLVISAKLRNGSFDPEIGMRMAKAAATPSMPQKVK